MTHILMNHLTPYNIKFNIIPAYRNKESFGDMDIILEKDSTFDYVAFIKKVFQPTELVNNKEVISFNYKDFQIDFIIHEASHYNFSLNYYSYNDLSNLIGRIVHKQGFKFGHDGLWYIARNGDNLLREILITRDWDKALETFKFDPHRWHQGFNDLEDIFNYVASNYRFNPNIFLLENRNHTARVRDKKRKTYMQFLEWCQIQNFQNYFEFDEDKSKYVAELFPKFHIFKVEHEFAYYEEGIRLKVKQQFNKQLLMQITGLTGKEFANFLSHSRRDFPEGYDWWMFVLAISQEDLFIYLFEKALSVQFNQDLSDRLEKYKNDIAISQTCT